MEKTSAPPRQPLSWHFSKLCTQQIKGPRTMLLKRSHWTKARSRHGRNGYVRVQCADSVVAISARVYIDTGGRSVDLSARVARSSKGLPKPDRRLEARCVLERSRLNVACCRLSTRHIRSSIAYVSHAEAPSVNDGCRSADSSGGSHVYPGVRPSEILHSEVSSIRQFGYAMARTRHSASCVELAGGYGSRDRMAYSRCVSVGYAFFRNAHFGGPVVCGGRPFVLVAYRAVALMRGEVPSMVDASIPVPCQPSL